jgi:hypothetical protein
MRRGFYSGPPRGRLRDWWHGRCSFVKCSGRGIGPQTTTGGIAVKTIFRTLLVAAAFAAAARLGAQESNDSSSAASTPQSSSSTEAAPAPQATPLPNLPPPADGTSVAPPAPAAISPGDTSTSAPPPAVAAPDTSAAAASQSIPSSTQHKASRVPRAKTTKETKEPAAPAPSDQTAAPPVAAAAAATAASDSTNPPPPPPASGEISSANSAVPTVPIADRAVQGSAETEARHGVSAGAVLLIGGLALAILGIATMLRRRGREESISIVDHSTSPRTGTTIAHHP